MAEDDKEVVPLKAGDFVWFVRPGESAARPARVLSDGIIHTQRMANGTVNQYAHLEYGTLDDTHVLLGHKSPKPASSDPDERARVVSQRQTHETTAPWNPDGSPGTWHLDGEAGHLPHPERVQAP